MASVQLRTLPVGSEVKLRMIDVYPEGGMWVAGISYTYRILHQGNLAARMMIAVMERG